MEVNTEKGADEKLVEVKKAADLMMECFEINGISPHMAVNACLSFVLKTMDQANVSIEDLKIVFAACVLEYKKTRPMG